MLFKEPYNQESEFKKWWQAYRLHVGIWTLFIIYETVVVGLIFDLWGHPLTYAVHYLLAISLFYLHAGSGLPWAVRSSRMMPVKFLTLIIFELAGYISASFWVDLLLVKLHIIKESGFHFTYRYFLKNLYREIYLLGLSTGYYFIKTYIAEKKRATELEKQRLEEIIERQASEQQLMRSQHALLKAQIKPHFLFNTLDFVYHKVLPVSQDAAEAVIDLADIMRFAITSDQSDDKVAVLEELEQVERLIHLHRLKGAIHEIALDYDAEELVALRIIPLLILTLAENMFKHGDLNDSGHVPTIKLSCKSDMLMIATDNRYFDGHYSKSTNIGMKNIQERLSYAYGDSAKLVYGKNGDGHFLVCLSIDLDQLEGISPQKIFA